MKSTSKAIYFCLRSSMVLPADLRTARTQDRPVALLEEDTVTGANFSFLMEMEVELEEQTPISLN